MVKLLSKLKWFVTTVALLLNVFIYFYPDILNSHESCTWKDFEENQDIKSKYRFINNMPKIARQKLLLNFHFLQEQGGNNLTSAYDHDGKVKDIHMLAFGDPQINGNWPSTKYIKRLDNFGNDYYLGHIYSIMQKRLKPSHVVVMGDMFSSQWIYDSEFYNRTYRYVERIFNRPLDYKRNVLETYLRHEDYNWQKWMEEEKSMDLTERFNSRIYEDVYDWFMPNSSFPNHEAPLFINLTGNHDIGYSGDITWQHMARFHYLFGKDNYVITYNKGKDEEWRIVVLDSMTLEGPALQEEFREFTWSFLENIDKTSNKDFKGTTILLTHIPLYKENGLCHDGPEHRYYHNHVPEPYKNGKLRSQNHLNFETTQKVLDIIFPSSSNGGLILTGHDHYGCNSWYNLVNGTWVASKSKGNTSESFSVRELVVTSMMGDFNGQTGILSGHFDDEKKIWDMDFHYCSFSVQHWWWAAKVSSLLALLLHSISLLI